MKNVHKISLGLLVFVLVSSFLFSVPVTAQQTELLFPLFKHSREYNSFWTVLGVKATSFVAVVDHDQLESSNYFVAYAFTSTIANVTVQVDIYDFYELWTDELGVERVNASQTLEPIVVQSFNQQVHKVELKLPECKVFKVVKISMGESSPYFMFEYKTYWDYQTTLWTNIDFFLQVQLVNWAMILFVAFIALGAAILFVSKARCIPPLSMNPMPQFAVTFVGLGLASMGSMVRPPDLFALTVGVFCVVFVGCMQLWNLKAPVKEALVFDPQKDKPIAIDLLEDGGNAQYIDRPSWKDTFLRLLGVYYIIENFHLFKRPTGEDATSDYLIYGILTKPKVNLSWQGLKPIAKIEPCRIQYYSKTTQKYFAASVAEKLKFMDIKQDLLKTTEHVEDSIKRTLEFIRDQPLFYKNDFGFSKIKKVMQRIPLVRRLVRVYSALPELLELRKSVKADLDDMLAYLNKKVEEFQHFNERVYNIGNEFKILIQAGADVDKTIDDNVELQQLATVGAGFRDIKTWLLMSKRLFPKNFAQEVPDSEFEKIEKALEQTKQKALSRDVAALSDIQLSRKRNDLEQGQIAAGGPTA